MASTTGDLWIMEHDLCKLEANIDDCTAEHLAFTLERLLALGGGNTSSSKGGGGGGEAVLDAWIAPILMKKGRAAHTIHCLCRSTAQIQCLEILFRHSTTLGVRIQHVDRAVLPRRMRTVSYQPILTKNTTKDSRKSNDAPCPEADVHWRSTSSDTDKKLDTTATKTASMANNESAPVPSYPVRVKIGYLGEEAVSIKPEFDDCRSISLTTGVSIQEISNQIIHQTRLQLQDDDKTSATSK